MPAANSIDWNTEELAILRLQMDVRFAGLDLRHHAAAGAASKEALVFKATIGEKSLEGCQPYEVSLTVTYQTTTRTAVQADALMLAVHEVLYKEDPLFAPNLPDLEYACLEPEASTERTDTAKLRKRVSQFPFLIKLID